MERLNQYIQELPRLFNESTTRDKFKLKRIKLNQALKTKIIYDLELKPVINLFREILKDFEYSDKIYTSFNLEFSSASDFNKKIIKNSNLIFIGNSKIILELAKYYKHLNEFVITTNAHIVKELIRHNIDYFNFEFPLSSDYPFELILFLLKLIEFPEQFLIDLSFSLSKYDFNNIINKIFDKIKPGNLNIVFTDSIVMNIIRKLYLKNKVPLFLEDFDSEVFNALPNENYYIIYHENSFKEMLKHKKIIETIKGIFKINLGKNNVLKSEVLIYLFFVMLLIRIKEEKLY